VWTNWRERKSSRRVPSVYHGLSGTKRERLILKGFIHCGMVHGFNENRTLISLKSLTIPAGFEPATHGVEIRYSRSLLSQRAFVSCAVSRCRLPLLAALSGHFDGNRRSPLLGGSERTTPGGRSTPPIERVPPRLS
jgi:hypothetical protein